MNKLFTKIGIAMVGLAMAVGVGVAVGSNVKESTPVFAAENDTHDFSQSLQQNLNNNATINGINIAQQSYPIKAVTINYRYNESLSNPVTITVSVGSTSFTTTANPHVTSTGKQYTTVSFTGDSTTGAVSISFTNNTGSGTGHGTLWVNNVTLTEGGTGPRVRSLSLNPTSLTMDKNESLTSAITVTADEGAEYTITAESSSTSVATCSVEGTTLTVNSQNKYGSATITVHAGAQSASLSVKVADPNGLKFLQQVTNISQISDGDILVLGAHYNSKVYAMKPVVEAISETNTKCRAIEITSAWSDTFGENPAIYTARIDINDYGMETKIADSKYTFELQSGNKIGYGGSGTAPEDGGTKTNWTIEAGESGSFRVNSSTSGRALAFSSNLTFGVYATGNLGPSATNYADMEFYKVVDLTSITKLSITCDGLGTNTANWATLKSSFEGIANLAWKAYYKHAAYEIAGEGLSTVVTRAENTDADIAQFVAKYDYIVHKYNKTGDDEFINRNGTTYDLFNSVSVNPTQFGDNNTVTTLIIIASVIGVTTIAGFFLLKKRKQD